MIKMASAPKQKPLLPVLKEKKRYIAYKIHAESELPAKAGFLVIKKLHRLLGVFGSAKAGLLPIEYRHESQTGLFKVSNASFHEVRAALLLIDEIQEQKVMLQPIIASGILRKAKQAM